ncbi:hypothetical protein E1B28_011866 [Marasmius oreades]|uniref:Uncharacterized protein n=1 Tax=Marasmius oreades TaxID=181124 RepID=A0A9P7RV14_9AGAR|nr:uncharacterized protein E1B28_011866 [Marasmius oreades]KAG7090269.1 hypothetical protein E1B28_011866 [Marasmius oreades]
MPHDRRHPDLHSIVPPRLTMSLGLVLPPSQPACSQPHLAAAVSLVFSLQSYGGLASFILFNAYTSSTTSDLVQTEKNACGFHHSRCPRFLKPVNETIREDQRRRKSPRL